MTLSNKKLRVQIEPTCVDLGTLLEVVRARYERLEYIAISYHSGEAHVYVKNAERMSAVQITNLLKDHVTITKVLAFSTVEGELQEEWSLKAFGAERYRIARADDTPVFVNPLGDERMHHVSSEYVSDLLKRLLNFGVFFSFGMKLYSLDQNVNFRARKKYKFVKVRYGREWVTLQKSEAYDRILENLVKKCSESVQLHGAGIPTYHLHHFNEYVQTIIDYKNTSNPMLRRVYERARNKGLDAIAANVNDRITRNRYWNGKKIKLV